MLAGLKMTKWNTLRNLGAFMLIGVILGYSVPPLFYCTFGLPSEIRHIHEHLSVIREGIDNDFYIDDNDIQKIMTLRLELAYLEQLSLTDWAGINKVRWWAQYLRRCAFTIEQEMNLRTSAYKTLKENPDGISVSMAEYERQFQAAQGKDQQWELGQHARLRTDRSNRMSTDDVFLRDYFLCDDRLIPVSYEEGIRKRYYVTESGVIVEMLFDK
jgi:hypothetical protein